MPEDDELIRIYVREKSQSAFTELVRRYVDLVYAAALRRTHGRRDLAEDATQQAFVALASHAARLQQHSTLAGWLYVTARHAAGDMMRSEHSRKEREQEAYAMETPSRGVPGMDWTQLRPELEELIDKLDAGERDAVVLRFLRGQTFAGVGTTLRISEDAARMRVDRALEKLRRRLKRLGIGSTGAALAASLAAESARAAPAELAAKIAAATWTAAAGGGAIALVGFMSIAKTITTTVAAIVVAGAVGVALYEMREARHAQILLAVAVREEAILRSQLQQSQNRRPLRTPVLNRAISPAPVKTPGASGIAAEPSGPLEPSVLAAVKLKLAHVGNLGHSRQLDGIGIDDATAAEIRAWLQQDPDGALQWLGSVPADDNQQLHTIEAVIAIEENADLPTAFQLANAITDEASRVNRFGDVLRLWVPRDPAGARAAVQSADLSDQNRTALLNAIDQYVQNHPPGGP